MRIFFFAFPVSLDPCFKYFFSMDHMIELKSMSGIEIKRFVWLFVH